jgi:LPXTG-site transpeptidase (sortase) family protein
VRGTRPGDLKRAPGLLDTSALPGERGTALIAGHRTTYGAPFRHIDRLRRGDRLTVDMPYGTVRYAVEATRIVTWRTSGHFVRPAIPGSSCPPVIRSFPPLVAWSSTLRRSA